MQRKYILPVLLLLLVLIPPACASTNMIAAGSPVFIGESNVDLTKALDNCRIIGWWPEGTEPVFPAPKNITLRPLNEISTATSHYTFSPAEYGNYTGTWYCEEKRPFRAVFVVKNPEVRIRAWDVENDADVTGMTLPSTANVSYRIETNLDSAQQLKLRPSLTPADSFWNVKLIDPYGRSVTNIYTGNYGAKDTVIMTLDNSPDITQSPYTWNFWKTGGVWNRAARSIQGELIYPPGTYTFTVSQNLNGMEGIYKSAGITDTEGRLTSSAAVTFEAPRIDVSSTPAPQDTAVTVTGPSAPEQTVPVLTTVPDTPLPAGTTPAPVKTTYQPLPVWLSLAGLGIAAAAFAILKK